MAMAATAPDSIKSEPPQLSIPAPINDGRLLLMDQIKVAPCPSGACEGGAKCLFLHAGEKGRRDPRRFSYCETLCWNYCRNGGSCPEGDGCPFAHGLLENILHRSLRFLLKYCSREEVEYVSVISGFHEHDADAPERAAINHILDLKTNGQICGYQYGDSFPCVVLFEEGFGRMIKVGFDYFAGYNVPSSTQLVAASLPDPSSYNTTKDTLAIARAAGMAIRKHGPFMTIAGNTDVYGKILTSKNSYQSIISSSGGGSPSRLQDFTVESYKEFFTYVVPPTTAVERVGMPGMPQVLCGVDASPTAGGINAPELAIFQDSAASMHVVCEETELQGYQPLVEPLQIAVADGNPLHVLGVGSLITQGRSFIVPKVFKVRGLAINLISVGQLDRDHGLFSGFHDGMCKVLKRDGDLIGGGFLQANNLYALRFLQVLED